MKHTRRVMIALALVLSLAAGVFAGVQTTLAYLSAQANVLTNTFVPGVVPDPTDTSVTVQVNKRILASGSETMSPEGFIFELVNEQTGDKFQLVSDASGVASITLPFTQEDVGKCYTYTLKEVNDGRTHVVYDTSIHTLVIAVVLNQSTDTVVATATMDGVTSATPTAEFVNEYSPIPVIPPLGDEMNLPLYALMLVLSTAGLVVIARKRTN